MSFYNYTIPRVINLKTIVFYCRRNARFPVHTSPPRECSESAARFSILRGLSKSFVDAVSKKAFVPMVLSNKNTIAIQRS